MPYFRYFEDTVLMTTEFLVVPNLAQDLHSDLKVCDSRALAALHCLLEMRRNKGLDMGTAYFEACKQNRTYQTQVNSLLAFL
jgi:hypothetical protein